MEGKLMPGTFTCYISTGQPVGITQNARMFSPDTYSILLKINILPMTTRLSTDAQSQAEHIRSRITVCFGIVPASAEQHPHSGLIGSRQETAKDQIFMSIIL